MVARNITVRGPVWEHLFAPLLRGDWDAFPPEQLFEGPAGTGKSIGISLFLDTVARTFPNARILVVRMTRVSLSQSWMVTFENKVLRENDPIAQGATRAHRQSYFYPNGTEIVLGGMDNETRLFSTEYDLVYVNEAVEFTEGKFESLYRALRNNKMPFQGIIADCNPDSEFHWLNKRCDAGRCERRVTRLWHNPGYWSAEGWTPDGASYRKRNKNGWRGVRLLRLDQGLWVTAEGAIIPLDKALHVLRGVVKFPAHKRPLLVIEGWAKPVEVRFFYATFDQGFRNPGTLQVWAVDDEKRPYLVRQVYRTGEGEDWWAEQVLDADKTYMMHRVVCDSARPEYVKKFNRVLREARDRAGRTDCAVAIGAKKGQANGKTWLELQAILMRRMFERAPDGMSRAYVFEDSMYGDPDPELDGKPQGLTEEAAGWTYEVYDEAKHRGMPKEIGDPDKENHAIDAASYGFEWLETHDLPDTAEDRWGQVPPPKGSWAEYDLVSQRMREAEKRKRVEQWH